MHRLTKQFKQHVKAVGNEIRQAFRGTLNLMKSGDPIQKTQVSGLADETLQDVELMQDFGFTSVPPAGTEAVIIPIGGKTTHGIVIATEHGSFRVKGLAGGEVAVYDESGSTIILRKGRLIEVECDTFKINCNTYHVTASASADFVTPKLETSAELTAQGQVNGNGATFRGDVVANGKSLVNHTHKGDSGGTTGAPI